MFSVKSLASATAALVLSLTAQSAFAQNAPISPHYLTGIWKESPQCHGHEAMVFFPNNTLSSAGSPPVNYTVTGPQQIMMYGPGGSIPINVNQLHHNSMVIMVQGTNVMLHRCGGGFNPPPPPPQHNNHAVLNHNYLIGRWTNAGNCANAEVFSPGGHFMSSANHTGSWTLNGNIVRIDVGNGNILDFAVQVHHRNSMTLSQMNQHNVTVYQRC